MHTISEAIAADEQLHQELQLLNELRLRPELEPPPQSEALADETKWRLLEDDFLAACRANEHARARTAPTSPDAFVTWFEALRDTGPGQHDRLFPWLEHQATLDELHWFLRQELAGEGGYDDLVALTQVRVRGHAKLELARNTWNEMGRELERAGDPVPEVVALSNLLAGFAFNRHYAYHAVGALGVVELTAPDRTRCVNHGLERLGITARQRQSYALHATLDLEQARTWNREVLAPLVAEDPTRAIAIAEGALMRLRAGERCFVRYRRELRVP